MDKADGLYGVNIQFNARVLIGSEWYRWFSDVKQLVNLPRGQSYEHERFIKQEIWSDAIEFVVSKRRSPLVWELLAGSEWRVGPENRRSALTETVTALEVAISGFVNRLDIEEAFKPAITKRMNVTLLKKWIERMGLSGTVVHYLFPLIFAAVHMRGKSQNEQP
ncbi:MAG: hypothetical protein GY796_06810 [Chloroflexi bacterium]|nr:hypothetical protein [Chloroflexota bacterium]